MLGRYVFGKTQKQLDVEPRKILRFAVQAKIAVLGHKFTQGGHGRRALQRTKCLGGGQTKRQFQPHRADGLDQPFFARAVAQTSQGNRGIGGGDVVGSGQHAAQKLAVRIRARQKVLEHAIPPSRLIVEGGSMIFAAADRFRPGVAIGEDRFEFGRCFDCLADCLFDGGYCEMLLDPRLAAAAKKKRQHGRDCDRAFAAGENGQFFR